MSVSHLFFNSLFTHTIMSPVYVALLMDGVDSEHHLCHIELGHVLWESVLKFTKQSQQIASHVIIHHQVLQEETLSSLITQHHSITQTLTHHLIISTEHQRVVWLTNIYHTTTQNGLSVSVFEGCAMRGHSDKHDIFIMAIISLIII